jgi:hypothetical protein
LGGPHHEELELLASRLCPARPCEQLGNWPGHRGRARHWAPVRAVRTGAAVSAAQCGAALLPRGRARAPVPSGLPCGTAPVAGDGSSPEQERGSCRGSPQPGEERPRMDLGRRREHSFGCSDERKGTEIRVFGFLLKTSCGVLYLITIYVLW